MRCFVIGILSILWIAVMVIGTNLVIDNKTIRNSAMIGTMAGGSFGHSLRNETNKRDLLEQIDQAYFGYGHCKQQPMALN